MLGGVEDLRIEADDRLVGFLNKRPGTGGEILQTRAHREDDIGLFGEIDWRRDVPVTPTAPILSG